MMHFGVWGMTQCLKHLPRKDQGSDPQFPWKVDVLPSCNPSIWEAEIRDSNLDSVKILSLNEQTNKQINNKCSHASEVMKAWEVVEVSGEQEF